jgi:hypothetical protein
MNNRLSVEGILCDIEKAFDWVDHGIVVDKLEFSGISGEFQTLIQPYLRGRYQNVLIDTINVYDGVFYSWKSDINGDLGDLKLGSLFILTHINDLPKTTDNDATVVLFADDTSITVTTSIQGEIQTI